ncbi:MAG: hypothetical protein R3B90_13640 [Planctomycetaceae bacterium]
MNRLLLTIATASSIAVAASADDLRLPPVPHSDGPTPILSAPSNDAGAVGSVHSEAIPSGPKVSPQPMHIDSFPHGDYQSDSYEHGSYTADDSHMSGAVINGESYVTEYQSPMPYHAAPLAPLSAGCNCAGGSSFGSTPVGGATGFGGASYGYTAGTDAMGLSNTAGGVGGYTGAPASGMHQRHPYYNYRAPWYYVGPASNTVTIIW